MDDFGTTQIGLRPSGRPRSAKSTGSGIVSDPLAILTPWEHDVLRC